MLLKCHYDSNSRIVITKLLLKRYLGFKALKKGNQQTFHPQDIRLFAINTKYSRQVLKLQPYVTY